MCLFIGMKTKKKVALIGTAGVPANYGGFETLAHNLVKELNEEFDLHVYASKKIYSKKDRPKYWNGARVHYIGLSANGISSVIYDFLSMLHAIFYADTLIILGVSGGIFIPLIRFFTKKKIIVNIDGLEWRREKWSRHAKKFLQFSEKCAVNYSHADITDNLSIKRYTSVKYQTMSHMIAYGADHVKKESVIQNDLENYPFIARQYAFKVARIEPENNVEMLLKAFSELPNEVFVFVGNWKSSVFGSGLQNKYSKYSNLILLDPIYDQRILNVLRTKCRYYVHGHSAGGTNPSLVEAMYLGLPIFAFDVSFNKETTHDKAIFFKDSDDLKQKIAATNRYRLNEVAGQMSKVAEQNYTWSKIANRYRSLIYLLEGSYSKPHNKDLLKFRTSYLDLVKSGHAHLSRVKNHSNIKND